jgi:hypothetical protein
MQGCESRVGKCRYDTSDTGYGTVGGCCEHGNEPSDFIMGVEFSD